MPNAFNNATKVTKSHIPAANTPIRIDVHMRQNKVARNDSSDARLKRGRPPMFKRFSPSKEKDEGTTKSK